MYDNLPDPFDGAIPSTSRDIGIMPDKIRNSTNIDIDVVDNINDNSNKIHKNANIIIDNTNNSTLDNTIIDKDNTTDKDTNISSGNTNAVNSNKFNSNNKTEPKKTEISNKKEKLQSTTHPLQSKKRQSFSQIFDKCVDKIIQGNADQIKTVVESNNKLMIEMMEKEKEMLQEQTQLLLQHLNTRQATDTSSHYFPAYNFPASFTGQSRFQQFFESNPRLQTSNQAPRFVKLPLNIVETGRQCSSLRFITPPSTPTPPQVSISKHVTETPSLSPGISLSNMNISLLTEPSCDAKNKTETFVTPPSTPTTTSV